MGFVSVLCILGSIPSVTEDIVNRTVCSRGHKRDCEKSHTIQVKNCTDFVVYYLTRTTGCEEAYCFGMSPLIPTYNVHVTNHLFDILFL